KLCDGSWLLEPTSEGKTRATYFVFTDSGINVPPFLANTISETGISKLFAAVRKQAKDPKYQAKEEFTREVRPIWFILLAAQMPRNNDLKKILLIGTGPIVIG